MLRIFNVFVSFVSILLFGLVVVSCSERTVDGGQTSNSVSESQAVSDNENQAVEIVESNPGVPGVITIDGLWFRENLEGPGIRQLDVGEKVMILGEKKADPNNSDRSYVPVRLNDDTEGWVSEWFAIPETIPAVLTKEAKVYSEPKLSKLTEADALPAMLIVAAGEEGATNGFVRISYSNVDGYTRIDDYIKADSLSYNERDITGAHLYALAAASEDESMKEEFLNSASGIGSPAFGILIDQARNALTPDRMENASVATVIVVAEIADIYSEPDRHSAVIDSFVKNEIIGVNGRSESQDSVDGKTDWWYSLESGGWIFGGDIMVN